jgi:hypothetical protein
LVLQSKKTQLANGAGPDAPWLQSVAFERFRKASLTVCRLFDARAGGSLLVCQSGLLARAPGARPPPPGAVHLRRDFLHHGEKRQPHMNMGATMGNVPDWVFWDIGWFLVCAGIVIIVAGTALLCAAAWGVFRAPKKFAPSAAIDVAKLLEALSKLPQWAIAVVLGNLQILMGLWMFGATIFGYKLLP